MCGIGADSVPDARFCNDAKETKMNLWNFPSLQNTESYDHIFTSYDSFHITQLYL